MSRLVNLQCMDTIVTTRASTIPMATEFVTNSKLQAVAMFLRAITTPKQRMMMVHASTRHVQAARILELATLILMPFTTMAPVIMPVVGCSDAPIQMPAITIRRPIPMMALVIFQVA